MAIHSHSTNCLAGTPIPKHVTENNSDNMVPALLLHRTLKRRRNQVKGDVPVETNVQDC